MSEIIEPTKLTIGEAIVIDSGTPQKEGVVVNTKGYGDLTLVIEELSGDGGVTVNVYGAHVATAPADADAATMMPFRADDGTITDFVVGASETGFFALKRCAFFIAIKAKYTTGASDANIYLLGNAAHA